MEREVEDLKKEGSSLQSDLIKAMDSKRKLHADLNRAADHCLEMEEQVYKANKISLDLLSKL
jgi:hypothetical protein